MRGSYQYFQRGVRAPVEERWERDATHVRSTRHVPDKDITIAVDARVSADVVTQADVRWDAPGLQRNARFVLGDQLRVSIDARPEISLDVPGHALLSPLMRVFLGPTLRQVSASSTAMVIVPDIRTPNDSATVLFPLLEMRSARRLGYEAIDLGDGPVQAARYEYLGAHYDADAAFWVGPDGLLMRYMWRDWRVDLAV
jgi:hypothetical protein